MDSEIARSGTLCIKDAPQLDSVCLIDVHLSTLDITAHRLRELTLISSPVNKCMISGGATPGLMGIPSFGPVGARKRVSAALRSLVRDARTVTVTKVSEEWSLTSSMMSPSAMYSPVYTYAGPMGPSVITSAAPSPLPLYELQLTNIHVCLTSVAHLPALTRLSVRDCRDVVTLHPGCLTSNWLTRWSEGRYFDHFVPDGCNFTVGPAHCCAAADSLMIVGQTFSR